MSGEYVMQERCIYCKREQYAPAVHAISHGEHGCAWCGEVPGIFTNEAQYRAVLNEPRHDPALLARLNYPA